MFQKKMAALIMAMVVLTIFFCSPVFAAVPIPQRRVTQHYSTATNLLVTTTATLLYSETYESAGMSNGYMGGAVTETVVTLRLYNSSSTQDCYVGSCVISLNYDSNSVAPFICGWEQYSTDLFIADGASTQLLTVVPSSDYSLWTGIVIPPSTSLYLIASIYTQAKNNTSSTTPDSVYLSSVTTNVTNVSFGNFDYSGDPTPNDLGDIVDSLNSIDTNSSDAVTLLQDIKQLLTAHNDFVSPGFNPVQQFVRTQSTGLPYFYTSYSIYTGESHIVQDTIDNLAYYHVYTRVVPITISIQWENYYDYAVANTAGVDTNALTFEDLLPRSQYISYELGESTSGIFQNPRIIDPGNGSYDTLIFDFIMGVQQQGGGSYQGLVPVGLNYSTFTINAYIRGSNTLTLNSSFTNPNINFRITDMKLYADERQHLANIDKNLEAFLNAYNSVNGTGDLSDTSNGLTEDLNDAHTAEQNYFEANSQALAASGISNPNFEASDRTNINSAITGNKNTFGLLWNAIGPWRNVYIYAALLCLVTYLLRHRPWIQSSHPHPEEQYKVLK